MSIKVAHSFLVYPAKNEPVRPTIAGTEIPPSGSKLFSMLEGIYSKPDDCNIDIAFLANNGEQQNDCRDLIIEYVRSPSEANGRLIAERLQSVTTLRSGLGLLFLMYGRRSGKHIVMLCRFPADNGILAEPTAGSLNVEFIEKVFMKSATAYKSAYYEDTSLSAGFWDGRAVDKQINNQAIALSDYWIRQFLASDFKTTGVAGTKRLASILQAVAKKTENMDVKEQIAAAAKLAPHLNGRKTSIGDFLNRLHLSADVIAEVQRQLQNQKTYLDKFEFDATEFRLHLAFRSVELDTGAILTAPAAEFDKVIPRESLGNDRVRYTAAGKVVDQKLKKTK